MADRSQIEVISSDQWGRTEGIEITKSTVTAHMKDMAGGADHFLEAVSMTVEQSWIPEECKRLAIKLIKSFDY